MDIPTLDSGPLMLKLGALAVAVIIPDTDSAGAKLRYPLTTTHTRKIASSWGYLEWHWKINYLEVKYILREEQEVNEILQWQQQEESSEIAKWIRVNKSKTGIWTVRYNQDFRRRAYISNQNQHWSYSMLWIWYSPNLASEYQEQSVNLDTPRPGWGFQSGLVRG